MTIGATRTPRLHQFSQSARLQKELLAASQVMPEPEPEPELAPDERVVARKRSLAETRANAKRHLVMKAQTPSLRAKAVAKAAVDSQWPSKNVSPPCQSSRVRQAERGTDGEDEAGLWSGRPAAGRPNELAQRVPATKLAEILAHRS